jgi:hypothetical protein
MVKLLTCIREVTRSNFGGHPLLTKVFDLFLGLSMQIPLYYRARSFFPDPFQCITH